MFSGITQAVVPIASLNPGDGSACYVLRLPAPLLAGLQVGASVGVDGVCLTVTAMMADGLVSFDVSDGTLAVTNLGDRAVGDRVNVERSLRAGDENGGHNVTGHVSGTARVSGLTVDGAAVLRLAIPAEHRRYVFARGFLAVNGCSLTVGDIDETSGDVTINLIPETIRQTSFSDYRPGDRINYEIELQTRIMVDTIERCIRQSLGDLTVRRPA